MRGRRSKARPAPRGSRGQSARPSRVVRPVRKPTAATRVGPMGWACLGIGFARSGDQTTWKFCIRRKISTSHACFLSVECKVSTLIARRGGAEPDAAEQGQVGGAGAGVAELGGRALLLRPAQRRFVPHGVVLQFGEALCRSALLLFARRSCGSAFVCPARLCPVSLCPWGGLAGRAEREVVWMNLYWCQICGKRVAVSCSEASQRRRAVSGSAAVFEREHGAGAPCRPTKPDGPM